MAKNGKPTETQASIAAIRALPRLKRTAMAYTLLLQDTGVSGRRVRRAFKVSGRQYRKALRQAKADAIKSI